MNMRFISLLLLLALVLPAVTALCADGDVPADDAAKEAALLSNVRQVTFDGKRAGEGYFSADGRYMVFQSEREEDNPFYQIYLLDLETGDTQHISPGYGKTTCSWIHPAEKKVLFASTHDDPDARKEMEEEIAFRESGQTRRYAWDYDEYFDLYAFDFEGNELKRLTEALGYDAEGSYSPDGSLIAFASNRHAYTDPPTGDAAESFERDKSYLMDIYLMNADGTDVRRLTDVPGYDGGPFFSPDGQRIVWRRFAENGATAEVYTMELDGTDVQQVTRLGAMSWAPFYHPSGDYLIFATNVHGFANFELYLVDAAGKKEPVRVTYTDGFDGLPVFMPDGDRLAWTSNRTPSNQSQVFFADWNDARARELLRTAQTLSKSEATTEEPEGKVALDGAPELDATEAAIVPDDVRLHVEYLASPFMEGRRSGTVGEERATAYTARVFEHLGLQPAGDNGSYFQDYEFTAGVNMGPDNELMLHGTGHPQTYVPDQQWRPLAFSKTGHVAPGDIVFAGYGIKAPGTDEFAEYDSFVHLDVQDKWVIVFRYMPEDITPEHRQHLSTHSSLRYKAMTLRDLGAAGMIVVSGPTSQVKEDLTPLVFDGSLGTTSIAAISVTDAVAQGLLNVAGKNLEALQESLDTGDAMMGFAIPEIALEANIDVVQEKRMGRNVIARLPAGDTAGDSAVLVGAHLDHLGVGAGSTSLMREGDEEAIHFGADDNASGVAGMFEIAQWLQQQKAAGELALERDVLFAAWSGEELGLLGSDYFAETYRSPLEGGARRAGGVSADAPASLQPAIAAYVNMDMIGRLEDEVVIGGVASSPIWPGEIERRNVPVGLAIELQNDTYLPTDATSFYLRGVPFINAFTGAHEDYHSPRDTADKLNYEGATKIARFMGLITRSLATSDAVPEYAEQEKPEQMEMRANLRAYLGTIPDYTESAEPGVQLSGVTNRSPADEAGLKQGDRIVELAGRTIENIYDYTFAIEALKIGETVKLIYVRDGDRIEAEITPGSRE